LKATVSGVFEDLKLRQPTGQSQDSFFICIALFEGNKKEKNQALLYSGIELTIDTANIH
jgi:hypothetical protein